MLTCGGVFEIRHPFRTALCVCLLLVRLAAGYDGGDCCECTCVSEGEYECGAGGYACIDPAAECVNDDDVTFQIASTCVADMIGDAYCDEPNNVEECGYDGGDCCPCTCEVRKISRLDGVWTD
ncbi:hypothetical protein Esi_0075_0042 [Ectocarpus siliculosus]|uniref:LNR domain-containing protein n=1 Tax=Ectocarpus siliculosus TaxID=2880 RepID=D7G6I3_ECTSI|nr:hypothetical protein Esi_0075_0042 [Ectocarpus siliculosus]|eukprot:CBJ27568.1 hypothetical protein Esi_0075_0042 [Ectocarpus siliculosus]